MSWIFEYDLHAPILCYAVTQWLMSFLLFPIAKEIDLYSTFDRRSRHVLQLHSHPSICFNCIPSRQSVSIAFLFVNHPSIHPPIHPFIHLSIHPSIHPSINRSISLNNTSCSTVLKSQHYITEHIQRHSALVTKDNYTSGQQRNP
ncbi:hypothetical protein C345_04149 [Cryptococcus neoformans A2-102-5]|nr:hypothetical protein C346_06204 [Cryptococcus neoformans var. grubii D17-1]OXG95021.1 hypothetical protein C345_04149 [Cryptococcus neoformans var. grubii A2-102-5]